MLKAKSFGNVFLAKAVHTSIYNLNRCATKVLLNFTLKEAY